MRNLKLRFCKEDGTGIENAKQLLLLPHTEHNDKDVTYIVTDSKIYAITEVTDDKSGVLKSQVIAELPDIVGAEVLQLDNAICVATAAGEVLLINLDTFASSEGTFCDVGIECMAWSPNQEVVAFVTKAKNVVVMTCNYEMLGEQPLDAELAVDQQFVNVGWGKKETQFHGTVGKQAAKQSPEFQAPSDVQEFPQDVHISWRGDGAFFAVSYVASNVGRTFNVYDNEGKLQYMAEKWNGLQSPLTWRPSGNWIALPQIFTNKSNKSTVSLFEKNGLRHREFELPFDLLTERIDKLQWSSDSDVLALQTSTATEQRIYLYTIGNYHWYLKQVLTFSCSDPLTLCQWSSGHELTLHVLRASGKRYIYNWNWAVDRFNNVVCVIDGKQVLLTNLYKAVVPPPMSQLVLQLDEYINAITCNQQHMCVYTSERNILFYANSNESGLPEKVSTAVGDEAKWRPQRAADATEMPLANFMCRSIGNEFLATCTLGNKTHLLRLAEFTNGEYRVMKKRVLSGTVNALAESNVGNIYAHTINNGRIYEISLSQADNVQPRLSQELRQPADYIDCWLPLDKDAHDSNKPKIRKAGLVTLRSQQLLQLDGERIDEDVTSFIVAKNYLIYTQLNALHFVNLCNRRKVSTRSIERGAKLVMHASDARLVLQLPRGNLEVIYPRVLLLEVIGSLLDERCYSEAMCMIRAHRINLNIICDHDLKAFCFNLNHFVSQMRDTQWLCLFLSELRNEDYALGMYATNYEASQQTYPPNYSVDRKVAYICELLCACMEEKKEKKDAFQLPIITAYVKLGKLEQALLLIWQHKQADAQLADQLLKYLLYLVDVNELYNVALGTYIFGLVLFVAQKSQKDPKEFLPYLNELKALPEDYRKFKIDEHLKRYESALRHLAACGEEYNDLAMDLIKQHNFYGKALHMNWGDTDMQQRILVAYADHLRANAQLEAASIMYERGGQLQQALLSAKHTLDWQRVIKLAKRAGDSIEQVASSMLTPLQQQDRHLEAYELGKQFTKWQNVPPLQILIDGHLYGRAIFEASLLQDAIAVDVLENRIRPSLISFVEQLKASLVADEQLFVEYKQRLMDIRQRQMTADELGDGTANHEVDIDELDLLSDTSSMRSSRYSNSSRSTGTGKTFRSSKNRRKHERKLLSLKPGNPFEDIALIDALHNQVTKIAHQQQQQLVRETCKALLQLHTEDKRAAELQQQYEKLMSMVQASLDSIWIAELMGGTSQHLTGPNIDYMELQKEQRYALISPIKRLKPQLNITDWQHPIL